MIDSTQIERITRLLAYMLRHQPGDFDLELDRFGYADVDEVLRALAERTGDDFDEEDLATAIDSGDRPRYEILGDKIRALYGHSVEIDPGETAEPPEDLFVALPARDRERMQRYGLRGGRRRFLHLALTHDEACETGRRAAIEYLVVKVSAVDAWEQGVDFYDRKSIWLAPELPTYALEVVGEYEDGTDPAERRRAREATRGGGRREERGGGRGRGRDRGERGGRGRGRDEERGGRRDEPRREAAPREEALREERPREEPRREEPRREERPAPKPAAPRAPAPSASDAPGFGFGAGVAEAEAAAAADRKAKREAAAPAPKAAPKPEPAPEPEPQNESGGFGAGL